MKRTIPVVLAVLALAACDDEQTKPVTVPTAPSSFAPMTAQASAQAAGISGGSTICRVYVTERDVAKSALVVRDANAQGLGGSDHAALRADFAINR